MVTTQGKQVSTMSKGYLFVYNVIQTLGYVAIHDNKSILTFWSYCADILVHSSQKSVLLMLSLPRNFAFQKLM